MLEICDIVKSFSGNHVLNSLSFRIRKNRVLGLLGPNGSGKTTTFRVIAGLMQVDAGDVLFAGQSTNNNKRLVQEKCGFLFGNDTGLYDRLTALENILYFSSLCRINNNDAKCIANKYAEILRFTDYLHKPVWELSKGTKQKVALTRTIIHRPEIIFLDEPTSGFDIDAIENTHKLIISLRDNGHTVVLASHNINEIEELCDDVVILNHGKAAIECDFLTVINKHGGLKALYHSIRGGREAIEE
jgi:sodium transport system ATP-binding protein